MDIDSISFGALPINNTKILQFDKKTKRFLPEKVKFVQIDSRNKLDITALDSLIDKWKGADYIRRIVTASHWVGIAPIEVYAITSQKDKFESLDSEKILGLAEMRDDIRPNYKRLHYLQVNPKAINVNQTGDKNYKLVGRKMIKSLKKIYKRIALDSADSPNIEKFYQNNCFIKDYRTEGRYLWSSNIIERIMIRIDNFRNMYRSI